MRIQDSDRQIDKFDDYLTFEFDANTFKWRVILLYAITTAAFLFLFAGTFQLQIVEGEKSLLVANRTNQSQSKILAPRGLIFDKNGTKLAKNVASYSLYIKLSKLPVEQEQDVMKSLADLLQQDSNEFWASFKGKAYNEAGVRSKADRLTLRSDLTFEQYFAILSKIETLPGVNLSVEAVRSYDKAEAFSNIIGYTGDPVQSDIDNGIYSEAQVGKTGIERQYDKYLRGIEGTSIIERETLTGKETQSQVVDAVAGDNLYLNVDARWQEYLQRIIKNQLAATNAFGGTGVIMNAKTGEVKAMATYPAYDNNLFANGISGTEYNTLINNPKKPLFNRPIALQLPPGSIMKIFGATAALESGAIDENTKFLSDRCLDLPGNIKFCEADQGYVGWVNVKQALARSSNIFFCKAMQQMHSSPGYTYYYDIAKNYGIGSKTGIDIGGEASGNLPSPDYKRKLVNLPWYIGDECNTVIGQGYVTVTPLQMTVAVSSVVNGGKVMEPHLLDKVVGQNGEVVMTQTPKIVRDLNISDKTLNIIKEGLRMGVTEGTAGGLKTLPGYIVGKTGSSDAGEWINGKYYSGAHSWLMGCFDNAGETYCFTIMQQWAGRGYKTVPIMKKFINCVYNNFSNNCEAIN